MFIVIEGPDGSGTTTQSKLLYRYMSDSGKDVILTSEPTEGPIGTFVRLSLDEGNMPKPEALQLLFVADRAQHKRSLIDPALEEGKTVISDRYIASTMCYGGAMGLDWEWLYEVNRPFMHPDITIVLLPPFHECLRRVNERGVKDALEEDSFQKKVYEHYLKLAEQYHLPIVDSSKSEAETLQEIIGIVENLPASD